MEENVRLSWKAFDTVNSHTMPTNNNSVWATHLINFLLDSENEVFIPSEALVNAEYVQLFAMYRIFTAWVHC